MLSLDPKIARGHHTPHRYQRLTGFDDMGLVRRVESDMLHLNQKRRERFAIRVRGSPGMRNAHLCDGVSLAYIVANGHNRLPHVCERPRGRSHKFHHHFLESDARDDWKRLVLRIGAALHRLAVAATRRRRRLGVAVRVGARVVVAVSIARSCGRVITVARSN